MGWGSRGLAEQNHGMGGNGFAPADSVAAFVGASLYVDLIEGKMQQLGKVLPHGRFKGSEPGAFGEDGDIRVGQLIAPGGYFLKGIIQKDAAGGVVPLGIGIGKQFPDVSLTDSAKQGIHQGMENHIAIGMSDGAESFADGDSAQNQFAARLQAVQIKTVANAIRNYLG